jgi:hypothetical protein
VSDSGEVITARASEYKNLGISYIFCQLEEAINDGHIVLDSNNHALI